MTCYAPTGAGLFHVRESKTSLGLFAKNRLASAMEMNPLFLARLMKILRTKDQLAGLSPVRCRAVSSQAQHLWANAVDSQPTNVL